MFTTCKNKDCSCSLYHWFEHFSSWNFETHPNQTTIDNPCCLSGQSIIHSTEDLFTDQSCTTGPGAMAAFQNQYTVPTTSQDYEFKGTGDPNVCKKLIEEVLDISYCVEQDFCTGDTGTYSVPPIQGHYLVIWTAVIIMHALCYSLQCEVILHLFPVCLCDCWYIGVFSICPYC